jgi:hypothetical protein
MTTRVPYVGGARSLGAGRGGAARSRHGQKAFRFPSPKRDCGSERSEFVPPSSWENESLFGGPQVCNSAEE